MILIPGIYIQYWIVSLITMKSESSSPKTELLLNDNAVTHHTSKKTVCIDLFKTILKLWQTVSVAAILVLDIWHFMDYKKTHSTSPRWSHYNCYVEIIVNSSNFKTITTYLMFYNSIFADSDLQKETLSKIFSGLVSIFCFMILPIGITHWIPSVVCFCWIVLCAAVIYAIFYGILYLCLVKKVRGRRIYSCMFGLGDFKDLETIIDESDGNMDKIVDGIVSKAPLFLILMISFVFVIPILSQCYWYQGKLSYIGAFIQVITERSVQEYLANITNEFSTFLRFLATIL